MKAEGKEYAVIFKAIMNHIPNNVRNFKLINLKENQHINKSIGSGQQIMTDFMWIPTILNDVSLKHYKK